MRNTTIVRMFYLTVFVFGFTIRVGAQCLLDYDRPGWKLVFDSDFDDVTDVSQIASDWQLETTAHCDSAGLPSAENIILDSAGGNLILRATRRADPIRREGCTTQTHDVGRIISIQQFNDEDGDGMNDAARFCNNLNKKGMYYGVLEIRAKLPDGDTANVGFWTYNGADEFDLLEYSSAVPWRFSTNFHDYHRPVDPTRPYENCKWGGQCSFDLLWAERFGRHQCLQYTDTQTDLSEDFHVYTMVWTPERVSFFFDGIEIRTDTRFNYWVCPNPLLITLGVATWTPDMPEADLVIDYVRVYQPESVEDAYMSRFEREPVGRFWAVSSAPDSLVVAPENNQVFYRNNSNLLSNYYVSPDGWSWGGIQPTRVPDSWKIDGDLAVGEGNRLYYRGADGRLHSYDWEDGRWVHETVGSMAVSSSHGGSLASVFGTGGRHHVYFRGTDGYLKHCHLEGIWACEHLPHSYSSQRVAGEVTVASNLQVFYRGADGRLQSYWRNRSRYQHAWIDSHWTTSAYTVSAANGALVVRNGTVWYRGQDDRLHTYSWSRDRGWTHAMVPDTGVSGELSSSALGKIFFQDQDGRLAYVFQRQGHFFKGRVHQQAFVSRELAVGNRDGVDQVFFDEIGGTIDAWRQTACPLGEILDPDCTDLTPRPVN